MSRGPFWLELSVPDPVCRGVARLLAAVARALAAPAVFWTCGAPDEKPRIYYVNHTSHLDFVVVWSALPPRLRARARPVAARDYWEGGPIRRFLARRVFRAILIDRGGESDPGKRRERARRSIERIASEMKPSDSLIVFPEGTRGCGPEPGPFRSGFYHLCRLRPDLPLVPVYVGNLAHILPKGATVPSPRLSRIVFGAPIRLAQEDTKDAFLERARLAICDLRGQRRHRRRTDEDGVRIHQTLGIARLVLAIFRHRRRALRRG
jgi:1-acyl-sn-glycerol-3-phosphate acyltransferase